MEAFNYRGGTLYAEDVALSDIAAEHGTPAYVYSRAAIEQAWRDFDHAFADLPHQVCYAVKANSSLAVLNLLARLGSGFDIVSGGELERVLRAGGDPSRIVFSGVAKTRREIADAINKGIGCFNVESLPELERIQYIASRLDARAPVSLRVNPDVDADTHPYISTGLKENKFGIPLDEAEALYRRRADFPALDFVGVDYHIGSQLTRLDPFIDALDRVLAMVDRLAEDGLRLRHLDIGGGLGVRYRDETPPAPDAYAAALLPRLRGRELDIYMEPGRAIVANAGVMLTRVEYLKATPEKHFALVDGAMNDLLRPALYGAWQAIDPVTPRDGAPTNWDVVGPVCETADFLGKDRSLTLEPGDLLAVRSAGAYGFVMASNYNTRPRPPELMVDGDQVHLIRRRETVDDLLTGERLLED
ncbi:diaminopimelate decarboxylase [Natronocella acetinitrilica]|uniref:Diaminopimelate decarboxylase n=1 Tax=Natronocella acetinitrilica TaxID=414046 RepID=A0AAE3G0Q6_9GAMM|nr:diaminopimelate decarboxylase [Natronocella acetinitrilica]MCP1673335.1 diaminopimelate decarboxylase [Natronocella acetinitrilica]